MNKIFAVALLSIVLGLNQAASAQVYYQTYSPVVTGFDSVTNTVVSRPVTAAYAPVAAPCCGTPAVAPVTTYSPVMTYSAAPVTTYSPAVPVTTYSPAVPVTTYSPVVPVTAYSPIAPVTSYLPMRVYSPTVVTSYSPVVAPAVPMYYSSPAVYVGRPYVPGEPVRNVLRAFWY